MDTQVLSLVAGTISTILFAGGNVPMLLKARRTKELGSYSLAQLALNNVGNAVHWLYISQLPFGPLWFLHAFYTVTTALMLGWYLRYRGPVTRRTGRSSQPHVYTRLLVAPERAKRETWI